MYFYGYRQHQPHALVNKLNLKIYKKYKNNYKNNNNNSAEFFFNRMQCYQQNRFDN